MRREELLENLGFLNTLINDFIGNKLSPRESIDTIQAVFTKPLLSQLLEIQCKDGKFVFEPLIHYPNLLQLLIYFCEVNPTIIKMSFNNVTSNGTARVFNLLGLVLENVATYQDLFDWIKTRQPHFLHLEASQVDSDHTKLSCDDEIIVEHTLSERVQIGEALIKPDDEVCADEPTVQHEQPRLPLQAILTLAEVDALSEGEEFDPNVMPYVNTRQPIDNSVLDAFLLHHYRDRFGEEGIAITTTSRNEPIDAEFIERITSGKHLPYTTGIEVGQDITPRREDRHYTQEINCIFMPVCVVSEQDSDHQQDHYGVFVLYVSKLRSPGLPRGFYIEPLKEKFFSKSMIYEHTVRPLVQHLGLEKERFEIVNLSQDVTEQYCPDYVIAVADQIASGKLDIINNPLSLMSLENQHMSEDIVRRIRMLQIKLFGVEYLQYQLEEKLNPREKGILIRRFCQPKKASSEKQAQASDSMQMQDASPDTKRTRAIWCAMFQDPEDSSAPQEEKGQDLKLDERIVCIETNFSSDIAP